MCETYVQCKSGGKPEVHEKGNVTLFIAVLYKIKKVHNLVLYISALFMYSYSSMVVVDFK